jgi:hypothetical protein
MRVRIAIIAGALFLVIALSVTLSGSPISVIAANAIPTSEGLAQTSSARGFKVCQAGEAVPRGTTAMRLTMESDVGPTVSVVALLGLHTLTQGTTGSGWTGGAVTVPVKSVTHTSSPVNVCVTLGPTREAVTIIGAQTEPAIAARASGKALPGRFKIEYMKSASSSWWSLASSVSRRMGLGRGLLGGGVVVLLIALMGVVVGGAFWLTLRELGLAEKTAGL